VIVPSINVNAFLPEENVDHFGDPPDGAGEWSPLTVVRKIRVDVVVVWPSRRTFIFRLALNRGSDPLYS
jgi:hypothetical protein